VQTCEVYEAEEVFDVVFPSGDESSEVVHPGKQPLHFPSFAIAAQLASVLGSVFSSSSVRRDQLDAVFGGELFIKRVGVVRFVADQPGRELVEEASGKNVFHKLALGWRSAFDRYGERKTVISGDSDDLGALAATGRADGKAPFFALAKVASTNASSRFNLPRSCKCRASNRSADSNLPLRTHCWNLRWQVWNGGYFSGNSRHCAPVPSTQNTPFSTERVSCQGRPRLSARRAPRSTGSTTNHCSSLNSQRPAISTCRETQSNSRMHHEIPSDVYETGSSNKSPHRELWLSSSDGRIH
jgi:hypothetical protein